MGNKAGNKAARISRRDVLIGGLAGTSSILIGTRSHAANPIKIGMPLALTGPLGSVGNEQRHGAGFRRKSSC